MTHPPRCQDCRHCKVSLAEALQLPPDMPKWVFVRWHIGQRLSQSATRTYATCRRWPEVKGESARVSLANLPTSAANEIAEECSEFDSMVEQGDFVTAALETSDSAGH